MLDDLGLEFEIEATDGFTTSKKIENFIHWEFKDAVSDTIPITSFGGGILNWQLFSIPYILDDNLIETIFNETGALNYKFQWRILHYLNNGDGTGKYIDAGEGINKIELGKGYWFNSIEKVRINIGAGQVNSEIPFTLGLAQGWNQIGNPYNLSISWNSVINTNNAIGVIDQIRVFDQTNTTFINGDVMQPFSGGFVWAEQQTTVAISPSDNSSGSRLNLDQLTNQNIDDPEWILPFTIKHNGISHKIGGVGMHPEASNEKDRFDKMALPRFINYLEMYTEHHDYFYPWFSTDIVQSNREYTWKFNVESNYVNDNVTFIWDNSPIINSESQLWLVDEINGRIINMKEIGDYGFRLRETHQFSVYFAIDPTLKILPLSLILGNAYPNPANSFTTIPLTLPDLKNSYNLELVIYNTYGQIVKTLASGEFSPGFYEFIWDGISETDQITSGLYLYRLSFNDLEITPIQKRLIIQH